MVTPPFRSLGPLAFLTLLACGEPELDPAPVAPTPELPAPVRSQDPRLVEARRALGEGDLESARALVESACRVAEEPEGSLLRARLALLEGDLSAMELHLAEARKTGAAALLVTATSAELHAWAGMAETAEAELAAAAERTGVPSAELLRARGVQLISTPDGVRPGLALLEQARELDPGLPYLERALGQAHLLVGRSHMATDKDLALEHAEASLLHDPRDVDARVFLADALMAAGDWGRALEQYEACLEAGKAIQPEVALHYKNAGVVALAQGHRDLALSHFLRARALGLDDAGLGSGATVLAGEAGRLLDEAERMAGEDLDAAWALLDRARVLTPGEPRLAVVEGSLLVERAGGALLAQDLEAAVADLERALELDPTAEDAHLLLGHVLFAKEDFAGAAEHWVVVVDSLRLQGIELTEPLHIRLADAQVRAGRMEAARETLEAYLVLEPQGKWAEATRKLKDSLGSQGPEQQGDE